MTLQKLLSKVRSAIDDYHMIEEGDRIAIGVSGGKDSIALLYALSHLKKFYPKSFELYAVTIDLGFDNMNYDSIKELCKELQIQYIKIPTEIAKIVFEIRKEKNPCSLCAKMRKGAFKHAIDHLKCNKIAYAHHKDDVVETMMLSLIYEGRFQSFSPVTYLEDIQLSVVRPLIYLGESDIIGFINKYNLSIVKNTCPMDKLSKREYVKHLIRNINLENPGVKNRMFTAIKNSNMEGWN